MKRRWFLVLLLITLVVGISWAEQLKELSESLPRELIIGSVLLAMALPLQIDAMWATLRRPLPALLATAINLLIVPALAYCTSFFLIDDLALGMIIAASVPCTLASAAVWTRLAGGNDAVSLLVTMITNLSCFLVTPGLIYFFAGRADSPVDFSEMAIKLLLLIVLPIIIAQLLRTVARIGQWATDNRAGLSIYAQLGLLTIVFAGAVNSGNKINELGDRLAPIAGQIALMMLLAALVHTLAWWIGYGLSGQLGLSRGDRLAVAFAGSQKTLMVGLAIALSFGGLTVLPMLVYHIEQLLIDTLLADKFRHEPTD